MTTEFNWSWVAAPSSTLKESDSINQSGGTIYTYRAATRGQLSAAEISSSIDSISTNINQQWTLWRSYIHPILDSLPAGARDQRWRSGIGLPSKIDALTYGVQGTTLFVFNDATSTNAYSGRYWDTDDERPKTIAEALEDVWSDVADINNAIESGRASYDDNDLWYAIGNHYENASLTSASSSLDARTTQLESNDTQLSDDLYGQSEGYAYDWGTPLTYSVTKNIEKILQIHGVAAWQNNPASVTHSHVGVTLDQAYDYGGAGVGRQINATDGSVYVVSSGSSDGLEIANSGTGTAFTINNTSTGDSVDIQDSGTTVFNIDSDGFTTGSINWKVSAKTSSYVVLALDTNTVFTNEGAVGEINFTLPGAQEGLNYIFFIETAQVINIRPASGDSIINGSDTISGTTYWLSANSAGHLLGITAINSSKWIVTNITGSWTIEEEPPS